MPAFQSHDNNITKRKAVVGKPSKNNQINKTLHAYLRHLDTLKMDKLTSFDCSECDKEDDMSFERNNLLLNVLGIGIFNTPGSTPGSTPGLIPPCTPPSIELLSDGSPANL